VKRSSRHVVRLRLTKPRWGVKEDVVGYAVCDGGHVAATTVASDKVHV
jgi:hypothetical protein